MDFKIVYFAIVSEKYGGVEQKVIAQFDSLIKLRPNVILYLVCSLAPNEVFAAEINKRKYIKVLVNTYRKFNNPFYRRMEKFRLMSNVLAEYDPANTMIYFRHPDCDLHFLKFLKTHKEFKIVTEHQEIENTLRNFKFDGRYVENILESLYGRKVRREIFAFVGVTPEITDFELNECGEPEKRKITIGNGIDVRKYPVRKLNHQDPEIIKLLFVGGGLRRHGLDRIIRGMATYNSGSNPYKIFLRIAGESSKMNENKALVKKLHISKYVEFLGDCTPKELDGYFNWADLGVGSLAFHRIGLTYTSNLKAREYFSRGIPFFGSTEDEDLAAGSDYILKIDSTESPVQLGDVVSFALKMRSQTEHPKIMREYALTNLDWSIKMNTLVRFLESLFVESLQFAVRPFAVSNAI